MAAVNSHSSVWMVAGRLITGRMSVTAHREQRPYWNQWQFLPVAGKPPYIYLSISQWVPEELSP